GIPARLDHDDLALSDGVEQALLRVVAAAVAREEVFSCRDETQRARRADDLRPGDVRADAVDEAGMVTALAQLGGEACRGCLLELGAQVAGETGCRHRCF